MPPAKKVESESEPPGWTDWRLAVRKPILSLSTDTTFTIRGPASRGLVQHRHIIVPFVLGASPTTIDAYNKFIGVDVHLQLGH